MTTDRYPFLRSFAEIRRAFSRVSYQEYALMDDVQSYSIHSRGTIWDVELILLEKTERHIRLALGAQCTQQDSSHTIDRHLIIDKHDIAPDAWQHMQELVAQYMTIMTDYEQGLMNFMHHRVEQGSIMESEQHILDQLAELERAYACQQGGSALALQMGKSSMLEELTADYFDTAECYLNCEDIAVTWALQDAILRIEI